MASRRPIKGEHSRSKGSRSSAWNGKGVASCNSATSSLIWGSRNYYYGDREVIVTSQTIRNPGRLFWGCPNFKRARHCNYMKWVDEDDEGGEVMKDNVDHLELVEEAVKEHKRTILKLQKKLSSERRKGYFLLILVIVSWLLIMFGGMTCVIKCNFCTRL